MTDCQNFTLLYSLPGLRSETMHAPNAFPSGDIAMSAHMGSTTTPRIIPSLSTKTEPRCRLSLLYPVVRVTPGKASTWRHTKACVPAFQPLSAVCFRYPYQRFFLLRKRRGLPLQMIKNVGYTTTFDMTLSSAQAPAAKSRHFPSPGVGVRILDLP